MSGTWCDRCHCHHTQEPFDEKALLAKMSKQIADDIDREIIESIGREIERKVRASLDVALALRKNSIAWEIDPE